MIADYRLYARFIKLVGSKSSSDISATGPPEAMSGAYAALLPISRAKQRGSGKYRKTPGVTFATPGTMLVGSELHRRGDQTLPPDFFGQNLNWIVDESITCLAHYSPEQARLSHRSRPFVNCFFYKIVRTHLNPIEVRMVLGIALSR